MKDGGPAFPIRHDVPHPHGGTYRYDDPGMSLRDWFAGRALAGLLANSGGPVQKDAMVGWGYVNTSREDIAGTAYDLADAMLAEREKGK